MKKTYKKILTKSVVFVICTLLMASAVYDKIYAAGVSVSATPDGNGGYTVNVGTSYTGRVDVSTSDGGYAQFWCESGGCSVTSSGGNYFTGSGTVSVSATPSNPMSDADGNTVNLSGATTSVNVTKPAPAPAPSEENNSSNSGGSTQTQTPQTQTPEKKEDPKNSDSALASLSIKEGKLSPEFKAGTTSYKVSLPEGTTSVNVSAKANDAKASVSGTGEIKVKAGSNKVSVTCTAEDGSTSVYTIEVNVQEKAVATMELNGKSLNVYQNPQGANLDNKAFEKTTVKINNTEVPAWKSEAQNLTLLYLNGEAGDDFYIYDEASNKVTSIYRPVGILGKNIVMVDVPEKLQTRKGMKFTTIEIDKVEFPGWTFEDSAFENYALIYVMDGQGTYVYYQYDKSENSLQLFSGAAAITQEKYEAYVKEKEEKEQMLMYVIYGLGAGCIVLLGVAGFFFVRRKPSVPKHKKVDIAKEDYENRFHIEKDEEEDA